MNGWLLDTNVIAEMSGTRPDARVERWFNAQPEHQFYLSILTIAEYWKGIEHLAAGDKRRPQLQRAVAALEMRFKGRLLPLSDTVVLRWGAISGAAKRASGHAPSVVDTLLAATALEHNLYFATRNVRDAAPSGAAIFNPWKDEPALFPL